MEVIIAKDKEEAENITAKIIEAQILMKKNSLLGLATGRTMENVYRLLIKLHKENNLDFIGRGNPVERCNI